MNRTSSQSGSVFFLILMAISIFGALSYIVFKDSRESESSLSSEKTRLVAQEIIAYGDVLSKAVHKLRLAGCDDTGLDFANTDWRLHSGVAVHGVGHNPTAPASGCSVFDADDGKVKAVVMPSTYMYNHTAILAADIEIGHGEIIRAKLPDIGSSGTNDQEVIYRLAYVPLAVCLKINTILGISNPSDAPPLVSMDYGLVYNGTFGAESATDDSGGAITGKTAYCASENPATPYGYSYLQVLVTR